MIKAFVDRLYPTKTQVKSLEEMLTTCRYWYNACWAERKEAYETEKKTISKVEQRLRLFGVGRVAVRWHRRGVQGGELGSPHSPSPIEGKIKTVRIFKKAGKWYACFACEVQPNPLPPTGKDVAIDVGIASLITTSDGDKVENPRWIDCDCGFSGCRDWNASLNLLRLGHSLWDSSSTIVGLS